MFKVFSLVAIIALASGCATQPTHSHSNAVSKNLTNKTKKEQVADNGDTVKCRYVQQTGTRFGTQICMKSSAWKKRDKKNNENAREELERASLNAQQTQNMPGQGN